MLIDLASVRKANLTGYKTHLYIAQCKMSKMNINYTQMKKKFLMLETSLGFSGTNGSQIEVTLLFIGHVAMSGELSDFP